MMYKDFMVGGEVYKLRLNTRNIITLEKMIGANPLSIFGDGNTLPPVTTMVNILYCSLLQLNHGITLDKAYDLFDKFLEEGNSMADFINIILDIYRVSGLIPQEIKEDNKTKQVGE